MVRERQLRSCLLAAAAVAAALMLGGGCTVAVPGVGAGSITSNNDRDCEPGEFCDTAQSPHYCFAAPGDGGDAGADAGDAGDAGGADAGDAGGKGDAGMDAGCVISGQAFAPGAVETGFSCAVCDPAASATSWSAASDGTPCSNGGGDYCLGGICTSGCQIDGGVVLAGALEPGNGCQVCNPDAGTVEYSNAAELTGCLDAGNFCHAGQCTLGCGIDGGFVASWTPRDAVVSGCCNPGLSTANWTPAFAAARDVMLTSHPSGRAVNDNNGDGVSDFAVTEFDNTIDVYLAQTDGGFFAEPSVSFSPGPTAIVSSVFTSSKHADLALLEESAPAVQLFYGSGDGTFVDGGTLPTSPSPKALTAADFGTNAFQDLVVAQGAGMATVAIWTSSGSSFGALPTSEPPVGASPLAVVAGHFRNQATNDIVVLANSGNEIDFLPNSAGVFSTKSTTSLPQTSDALAVANFASVSSVVVGGTSVSDGGYVQIWFSLTDGGFASSPALWIGAQVGAVVAFRRDGGTVDSLASADSQTGSVTAIAFLDGGLAPAGTYPAGSSANAIATGDFNGDGLTDLAVSDPSSSVYILYGQCR